jgi:hypothetical protein
VEVFYTSRSGSCYVCVVLLAETFPAASSLYGERIAVEAVNPLMNMKLQKFLKGADTRMHLHCQWMRSRINLSSFVFVPVYSIDVEVAASNSANSFYRIIFHLPVRECFASSRNSIVFHARDLLHLKLLAES